MNSKALLAATALILSLSAVSCGKEDGESSVSISYGETTKTTAAADTTEEEAETTATETTAVTTAVSGTETTTTAETEQTETSATETSADTETTTSAPAETTAPETSETPAETSAENNTPALEENNNDDNSQPDEPQVNEEPTTEEPTENNTLDFKFTVDNLLNDASGLLSTLGTPDYSGEAAGCTTNGNDVKIYRYEGLEVQCYIDGGTEYIFSIEITSDKYETDRGIKVGSSRAEVESAYGTGETSGNMTVYYTGNNEMDIEYSGDNAATIFFYAPV